MRIVRPSLTKPQARFLALPHKFRAMVAGYGSGKSWAGAASMCSVAYEHPGIKAGYFAPTYGMIRDIYYPTIEEVAEGWGLHAEVRASAKEVDLYEGTVRRLTVICRSMDNPSSIIGFKIGHAHVDEIDTMPAEKATQAWRRIIARMRYKREGLLNRVDVTTTPEGFRFVYKMFVEQVRERPQLANTYGVVHASTHENARNLPEDYIDSLLASYPVNVVKAYIDGQFVNLESGSVYPEFDRVLNHCDDELAEGEIVHVGMDFNVLKMAATIGVVRDGEPRIVGELVGVRDTPAMVDLLMRRYRENGHQVVIYPDASGANTSSRNASESDIAILRKAGLTVRASNANPAVKDRVNAVNAKILNGAGVRGLKINTHHCPTLTQALEQQPYDSNGEPDKSLGIDHIIDALGYHVVHTWPITRRIAIVERLEA